MRRALFNVLVPFGASLAVHAAVAGVMGGLSARAPLAQQVALQVAVIDKLVPPPAKPPPPKPVKLARAPKAQKPAELPPPQKIVPPPDAPPPPTQEAKELTPNPVIVTGITMESTSAGGSFAVGVGNTLRGDPGRIAVDPATVKPYKAERYAPSAQVTELPSLANREALNLRKYYPPAAKKNEFEGDVVLRLLVDADGRVVKAEVVSDPGEGLGPAAVQAALHELRFTSPKVNGMAVATTIPFTMHFTLD
jgi:protein TonB